MPKIEAAPDKKRKKTSVDLEGENFIDFIVDALSKKQGCDAIRDDLISNIQSGDLKLGLEKNRIIEAGNVALKVNKEFHATDHFVKRCNELADDLIEQRRMKKAA